MEAILSFLASSNIIFDSSRGCRFLANAAAEGMGGFR